MRVLLVSPAFHGYWRSFARGLESLGHIVDPFVYHGFGSVGARVRNKLVYELPDQLGFTGGSRAFARHVTRAAVRHLEQSACDAALIVKGDVLESPFWDALDERRIPNVLYLYDDLAQMRHDEQTMARPGHLATFSRRDHTTLLEAGYRSSYVPAFFDPEIPYSPFEQKAIVFVGSRYAAREATLVRLHRQGVPVVAYGREWSSRLRDRLRCWELRRRPVPGRPDVSRGQALGIVSGAAAAVNLHAGLDGFNPRTFEICGTGGLQLIDRVDVDTLYEPGREIVVFRSPEELEEVAERALRDPAWARPIREAARSRTLAEHTVQHRSRQLASLW